MKKESIIFDLDGTLWDASKITQKIWNETFQRNNHPEVTVSIEDIRGIMGHDVKEISKIIFPNVKEKEGIDLILKASDNTSSYICENGANLYEDIEETLEKLSSKYKLCLVSNCYPNYLQAFFNTSKLKKYFFDFDCAGNTGLDKGDTIRLVIERNDFKDVIYVGDTVIDQEACKKAGIDFVYAYYGFGAVEEGTYKYKLNKLKDLIDIFY